MHTVHTRGLCFLSFHPGKYLDLCKPVKASLMCSHPGHQEADRQAEAERAGLQHPRRAHQGRTQTDPKAS
jgi:hypothetical protein